VSRHGPRRGAGRRPGPLFQAGRSGLSDRVGHSRDARGGGPSGIRSAVTLRRVAYFFLLLLAFLVSQISPAYFAFGFAGLFWFLAMRQGRAPARSLFSWPSALALLYAVFIVLSPVSPRAPPVSARHVAGLSLLLLLPMTMDLADTTGRARLLFDAIAANSVILSVIGFWQFAHGGNDMENRIMATLSHWMTFSGLAMIAGCLLLGVLFEDRG